MEEEACLVTDDTSSIADDRAGRLLEFFGVPFRRVTLDEFEQSEVHATTGATKSRLVCSGESFRRIAELVSRASEAGKQFHSIFIYPAGDTTALAEQLSDLLGEKVSISAAEEGEAEWTVANDEQNGLFGSLWGRRVRPSGAALGGCGFFEGTGTRAAPLLSAGTKSAFMQFTWKNAAVFVTSHQLIDIDAELTTPNFDLRDHLFSALPAVAYIKWAFPRSSWRAPKACACLVIDDPLLKPRYGFLRFKRLLTLMQEHNFSTSIAFIPWNWRRSDRKVVQLFKDNPESYSLSIHGCDHTAGEFGARNRERVALLSKKAMQRMSQHEKATGLVHDRVMVFPQGVFSAEAIPELKRAGFQAVVNTEVHSKPPRADKIKISEVWDVALMSYGELPIYTRRYPAQGVENLAFDLLLGKPCLVVIHHDFCRERCAHLVAFIRNLNALRTPLEWRSLGEVVKSSYRQRELNSGATEIEMYGTEALIENRSDNKTRFEIRRRESDPSAIEAVRAGAGQLHWHAAGGYLHFAIELAPFESSALRVKFREANAIPARNGNVSYQLKTMLRRYLSEVRDNYVTPAKSRFAAFSRS